MCRRVNDRRYCIRKSAQLYFTILIYFSITILCIFDINLLQTLYTLYYTNRLSSILCRLCIFTCIKILLDLFCSYKTALFIYITWCSVLIVCTCVFVFVLCVYECVWVHLYVCWSQTPSAANQHCPHTCHHPHNLRTRQAVLGLWLIIIIIIIITIFIIVHILAITSKSPSWFCEVVLVMIKLIIMIIRHYWNYVNY